MKKKPMKISNRTQFDTAILRMFFKEAIIENGLEPEGYYVEINHARGEYITGWGYYHRKVIQINIPKEIDLTKLINVRKLAQVTIHELDHNRGLKHKEMLPWNKLNVEWAAKYIIETEEPKVKPRQDKSAKREENARKKVDEYKKKIKRYQNLLKKWNKKVAYYDRKHKAASTKEES